MPEPKDVTKELNEIKETLGRALNIRDAFSLDDAKTEEENAQMESACLSSDILASFGEDLDHAISSIESIERRVRAEKAKVPMAFVWELLGHEGWHSENERDEYFAELAERYNVEIEE